jgi:hypothetical protein
MSHIRINASQDSPVWADTGGDIRDPLRAALRRAPHGPIVIMIHGYKFSPSITAHSPHHHILSLSPDTSHARAVSWPHHLGFGGDRIEEGLSIAFGWEARGTIWSAYRQAELAGRALAKLTDCIAEIAPDRVVDVVAHSLGARVFLSSLAGTTSANLGRAIIMAGAEIRSAAQRAMDTRAGRMVEVLNITSRENDLYDFYIERAIAPFSPTEQSLGHGLKYRRMNWLDLQLDCPHTLAQLRHIGFPIAAPTARVCHWSTYLRPGMFPLYRAFLRDRDAMTISTLSSLRPVRAARRWSRICALPHAIGPLIRP